ncbi:MAG TPA: rhodanese-like domain-containing protein [Mycobacteriales bacterium]|nr:rhodanese-like domain-containing protein [Mycobacteriales bacterium]
MAQDVSVADAHRLVGEGAMLLDVREDDEWAEVHAPDAMHVPMSRLGAQVDDLPRDRMIACICHVGGRSAVVADALAGAGFSIVNVAGGMDAWESAGLPVVRP